MNSSTLCQSASSRISKLDIPQPFNSGTVSHPVSAARSLKTSPSSSYVSPPIAHSQPVSQSGVDNVNVPPMPSTTSFNEPATLLPISPAETLLNAPVGVAGQIPLFAAESKIPELEMADSVPPAMAPITAAVAISAVTFASKQQPKPYRTQTEVMAEEIAAGIRPPVFVFNSSLLAFADEQHDKSFRAQCKAELYTIHRAFVDRKRRESKLAQLAQKPGKKAKSSSPSPSPLLPKSQILRQPRVKKPQKPLPPPLTTRSSTRAASLSRATASAASVSSTDSDGISPAASAAAYAVDIAASAEPMVITPLASASALRPSAVISASIPEPVSAQSCAVSAPVAVHNAVAVSPRSRRTVTSGATRGVAGSGVFPIENYPRESGRRGAVASREDKDFGKLPNICPPLSTLDNFELGVLKTDWKGNPIDLAGDAYLGELHEQERVLASTLRLDCATYLTSKRRLFLSRLDCLERGKMFRKTDAQTACHIDVNKASRLYMAYEKVGWLQESWFEQHKYKTDLSAVQKTT